MYLWFIAAIVAYFVKGLCGFANTLIFTSILSFGTVNVNISPVDLVMGYPANLILAWKNRKKLDSKVYLPLSGFVLAGSIPGTFILKNMNTNMIKIVFGIVVISLGIEMLVREYSKKSVRTSRGILWLIGILSGLICGMFGVGALLAAYVSRVTNDSSSFKANISAVFMVDNTFRMILYSNLHILTFHTLKISLILLPCALLGMFTGIKCSSIIEEKKANRITSVLLVFSGISLILKSL